MNNRHIFGNGPSAYIIATTLASKNIDFIIHGKGEYKPQPMLYLEIKNNYELYKYFKIFGISIDEYTIAKYTKMVNIGFMNDNFEVLNKPTPEMVSNYLKKQNRDSTSSAMSDGNEKFYAIDLSLIMPILIERFKDCVIEEDCKDYKIKEKDIIYNTVIPTKRNEYYGTDEYILPGSTLNLDKYDYVYDCTLRTKVKRYSKDYIEYLTPVRDASMIKVTNYYDSPEIYKTYFVKGKYTIIDISRNATRTQLKQKDIIEYVLNNE